MNVFALEGLDHEAGIDYLWEVCANTVSYAPVDVLLRSSISRTSVPSITQIVQLQ